MSSAADFFLVLGAKPAGPGELVVPGALLKPVVLDFFPPSFSETTLIRDLPLFCFPAGLIARGERQDPRSYTMALTDDKGRLYAHCFYFDEEVVSERRTESPVSAASPGPEGRAILSKSTTLTMGELPPLEIEKRAYLSRCMCLLSRAPLFNTFKTVLTTLYQACQRGQSPQPLEVYISHLILHTPLPPTGLALSLPVCGERIPMTSSPLPRFNLYDVSIVPFFQALDLAHIATLLAAILTERKVLFISSSYAMLSLAAETLSGLIWPLQFPHTYIPVVPASIIECVEAPTPFVMGVHSSCRDKLPPELSDVLIADLDNNRLTLPDDAPPPLPAASLAALRQRVWPFIHPEIFRLDFVTSMPAAVHSASARAEQQAHIQGAYLHFIFELYTSLVSRLDITRTILEPAEYLKQLPEVSGDAFLSQFVESQAFRILMLETEKYRVLTENDVHSFCRTFATPPPRAVSLRLHECAMLSASGTNATPPRSPGVTRRAAEWRAGTFPELKRDLFLPQRRDMVVSEISALAAAEKSAPLLLFRAQLSAQGYGTDAKPDWSAVFSDIEQAASSQGTNYNIVDMASNFLAELTPDELASVRLCGPFVNAAVARHIKSVQSAEAREEADLWAAMNADVSPHARSDDGSGSNLRLSEEELRVSKANFIAFTHRSGVAPDEQTALRLFESLSRLGTKKQTIRSAKLKQFLQAYKEIMSQAAPIPLLPQESVVYASDMQLMRTGHKGRIMLTDKRLLFVAKQTNKIVVEASYVDMRTIEMTHARPIVFAPTFPALRITLSHSPTAIEVMLPSERALIVPYLKEMVPAYTIANDVGDERFIKTSLSRIRLCEAARRVERRAHVLPMLSGAALLQEPWHKRIKEAEKLGILNMDRILTGLVSPRMRRDINPLQLSLRVLEIILDLFYAYMANDGVSVDWKGLSACDELDTYHMSISSLSKVDLRPFGEWERLAFFVNVYNALVLHAFLIHGGFPASYLEWRYITKSAHYSIGGSAYSLDDILHGILRGNAPLAHFSRGERFPTNDPRREYTLKRLDPRVHFLICYHFASSPNAVAVRPDAAAAESVLKKATEEYIKDHVSIVNKDVRLPALFQWYRSDFGATKEELINFLAPYLPAIADLRASFQDNTSSFVFYFDWRSAPKPLRATAARMSLTPQLLAAPPHTAQHGVSSPTTARRMSAFQAAMNEAAKELEGKR